MNFTKTNLVCVLALSLLSAASARAEIVSGPYTVDCRAKVARTDTGAAVVAEFKPVAETDSEIVHGAEIDGIRFELHENKHVFFFKPVIKFPNGQALTTTGYFDATGGIRLESNTPLPNGARQNVDIRCCRDCTYSDWPAHGARH